MSRGCVMKVMHVFCNPGSRWRGEFSSHNLFYHTEPERTLNSFIIKQCLTRGFRFTSMDTFHYLGET